MPVRKKVGRSTNARSGRNSESGLRQLLSTAELVLTTVSEAVAIVLETSPDKRQSFHIDRKVSRFLFRRLNVQRLRSTGTDDHLVRGLFAYGQATVSRRLIDRPSEFVRPRLTDLIMMHCRDAESEADKSDLRSKRSVLIPSPLLIAIEALTVPEDVHTGAYALLACRMILSKRFSVWPEASFSEEQPVNCLKLSEASIVEEIRSIRTFLEHRDNRSAKTNTVKQFISHFIAAKGVFYLRMGRKQAIDFLRHGIFSSAHGKSSSRRFRPEFRLSKRYKELPQAASFVNEMVGVPVALRGADTILFNGLKPSSERGLVMEISGGSGTGKTTFALALAAAFAPLDTQTLYLTFEESEGDLRVKLASQSQQRLRRLSFSYRDDFTWFTPNKVPAIDLDTFEKYVLEPLRGDLQPVWEARRAALNRAKFVPPLPLIIVVDSVSAIRVAETTGTFKVAPLLDDQETEAVGGYEASDTRQRLVRFVEKCRAQGALVLLLSSENSGISSSLDYLVDVVIDLRVKNSDDHASKPLRLFTLSKARHQIARHGTHVFHLTGENGFRFAPQLPSQIDAQQSRQHVLWNERVTIEVLNVVHTRSSYVHKDFLPLATESRILLHGRGSAGKAGLALKIALAPRFENGRFRADISAPRVLVVSFLYPSGYYDELRKRILKRAEHEWVAFREKKEFLYSEKDARQCIRATPKLDYVQFAPGFLSAEDLYSKFMRALEGAHLEGRPYTAVIIDGLHNLALQFPGARDTEFLWPIMYGTLARTKLTTITTFTTLELLEKVSGPDGIVENASSTTSDMSQEAVFRLQSHLPLMHTLVQASDYVIEVAHTAEGHYLAQVRSAISRDPPAGHLAWNRQSLEFTGYVEEGTVTGPSRRNNSQTVTAGRRSAAKQR